MTIPRVLRRSRTAGQALVEVAIAAGFFLVPLFLLLTLVGKLIDLKMTTLEAARYVAFQRTITSNQGSVRGASFAQLSDTTLGTTALMRFYSQNGVDTGFSNGQDSSSGYQPLSLWTDDSKTGGGGALTPFLPASSDVSTSLQQAASPFLSDETAGNLFADVGEISGFQWNTQGYFTATVQASATLPVTLGDFLGHDLRTHFRNPLTFSSTTAIMADVESAPNSSYVSSQIQGTLVTSLLSGLQPVLTGASVALPDIAGLNLPQIVTNSPTELPCDRLQNASNCPP